MKALFCMASVLLSVFAHAESIQTNYTLTPEANQFDLRGQVVVGQSETDYPRSSYKVESDSYSFKGSALFGISDAIAVGIGLQYLSSKAVGAGTTFKAKGLRPLEIGARSNIDLGGITLYLSPTLNVDLERAKSNNDDNTSNVVSGQNSVTLEAGAITKIDVIKLGAIWGYNKMFNGKRESINSGISTTDTLSQGDSMALGALVELEHPIHPSLLIARAISYETKTMSSSSTSYSTGSKYTSVELMTRIELSESLQILPMVQYYRSDKKEDDSQLDAWELGATARYLF